MWHTYCKNILLCRLIRTYWSKKLVSLHGLTHLYWEQKPIVPVSLVKAIGIDRQTRIPIEGVNRYRHEIPQNIDIPIGILSIQSAIIQQIRCASVSYGLVFWNMFQHRKDLSGQDKYILVRQENMKLQSNYRSVLVSPPQQCRPTDLGSPFRRLTSVE